MLAGALAAAAVVALVGCLLVLALAPRLQWFDDQRRRGIALVTMASLVAVLGVAALLAVRREAAHRERAVSRALYAALQAADPDELLATASGGGALPGGATSAAELQGGGVAVYRPVEAVWVRWCVVGVVDPDGEVTVERLHRRCP